MKVCARCGVNKPLTEYHKDSKGKQGLRRVCKPCAVVITDQWQRANPEKAVAKSRRYHEKHKVLKTRTCLKCGVEFPANGKRLNYCTDECRTDARCSVDGCDDPVATKEKCRKHYMREWEKSQKLP